MRSRSYLTNDIDPRNFGRGFDPARQRDQAQNMDVRLRSRNAVQISDITGALQSKNAPAQLVQATFLQQITKALTPVLLIPYNTRRQSLKIGNFQAPTGNALGIVLSFGSPINAGGTFAGLPIPSLSLPYEETNGTISVDDIYVTSNDVAATYPIWIIGYEGTFAFAANKI